MHIYDTPDNITAFSTTQDGDVLIDIPRMLMPLHQVHETTTIVIDEVFVKQNPLKQALALDGVDALSTNLEGLCICVRTADCIPILVWDDQSNAISAIHAGWKGTLKRIVEQNIDVLATTYGTQPHHLHAIIGPGIGPQSFEVGDEVYEAFLHAGFPINKIARLHPLMHPEPAATKTKTNTEGCGHPRENDEQRWHIDLWECNRLQLINKGVQPENIHVAGIDTYTNHNIFFSARRGHNGRIINGIMRNPHKQ